MKIENFEKIDKQLNTLKGSIEERQRGILTTKGLISNLKSIIVILEKLSE